MIFFLGVTFYSHSGFLHPGLYIGTGEFDAEGVTLRGGGEGRNTASRFMLLKPEVSSDLMGQMALIQSSTENLATYFSEWF